MGFPKQEHWSGLPFSFLRELPDSGIKHPSPVWRADSLLLSHQGSLEDTVQRCIYLCPWPQRSVGSSEEAGVLLRSTDALLGRGAVPGVSDRQGLSSFFLFPSAGLGRSPVEGNGYLLQCSCLENPKDRGAWQATVHGVARIGHDLVTKPPPSCIY